MMRFCEKNDLCARPDGHLGCCTPAPNVNTQLFDFNHDGAVEAHVRRAVLGHQVDANSTVAPVLPEFRPERFR